MKRKHRPRLFEALESRTLLSGITNPATIFVEPNLTLSPLAGVSSAAGYSPAQIASAYGFDEVSLASGTTGGVKGDGSGQTIAIVDAFNDPNIAADLHTFDQTFGLSDP